MKNIFSCICFIFLLIAKKGLGQTSITSQKNNDAELWQNIYLEKNITPKLVAHINQEARFTENLSALHYNYFDEGVTYKIRKWLRFSVDYVFLYKKSTNLNKTDFRNSFRHQFYIDFVLRKKFGKVTLSDRTMFQWEWDDPQTTLTGNVSQLYLRNKLYAKYNTGGPFSPYIAEEQYYSLVYYDKYGKQLDRSRYYLGCFYAINAVNELEAYYMIERHFNVNFPQTNWIIGVGYSHSFYSGGLMGKW